MPILYYMVTYTIALAAFSPSALQTGFMQDMSSPLKQADLAFGDKTIEVDPDGVPKSGDEQLITVIDACHFHSMESLPPGSTLTCNLFDESGKLVASGSLTLSNGYTPNSVELIPISEVVEPNANQVENVHSVQLTVG